MTTYACGDCGERQPGDSLRPTVVPGMMLGRCAKTKRDATWRVARDDRPRDVVAGQARRDQVLATLEVGTQPWSHWAATWIASLPLGKTFTADDMTDAIGLPDRHAAVGSAIAAASRRRLIARTGEVVPSRVVTSNASIVQVWRRL